jgi:hypothetical protein
MRIAAVFVDLLFGLCVGVGLAGLLLEEPSLAITVAFAVGGAAVSLWVGPERSLRLPLPTVALIGVVVVATAVALVLR